MNMKHTAQSIKTLEKRHPEEWILVEVTKEDSLGNPIEGKLLTHSKSKEQLIEKAKTLESDVALFYSGDIPKKGYAFCF